MPSKSAPSASKGKAKPPKKSTQSAVDGADEEPLAAVLLADSFDARFSPLTISRPRCMLPICGVPMVNLILERLLQANVNKVYVLSRSHTALLREHIEALRQSGSLTGIDIVVYGLPEATCVGQAMQELDSKQVIRGDFVLVQPDAVGNVDIREMVRVHMERKKRDREAIMTIGMMPVGGPASARSAPPSTTPIVALRPGTHQLLHWHGPPVEPVTRSTALPFEELFANDASDPSTSDVEVRMDLRETGIDICGIEVPPLFQENFDYRRLRSDFVVGVLTSDILDSRLFLHVAHPAPVEDGYVALPNDPSGSAWGYGARCDSTKAYDGISVDVLHRLTWPLSPGSPAWPSERLESRLGSRFIASQGVRIDRTAMLGKSVLISSNCQIEAETNVVRSTLCQGVSLGSNSSVIGSHLFEGVSVGNNCSIVSSIVGKNVKLLDGVSLAPGCLIGDDVVIGPNVALSPDSRVAIYQLSDVRHLSDEDLMKLSKGSDPQLGKESVGYLWPARGMPSGADEESESDDEEEADPMETANNLRHLVIGHKEGYEPSEASDDLSSIEADSEYGDFSSEEDSDHEDDHAGQSGITAISDGPDDGISSRMGDMNLSTGPTSYEEAEEARRLADFRSEAAETLQRAFEDDHTIENATIELKTLRMSSNAPQSEVRKIVVEQLLEGCSVTDAKKTTQWLSRWSPLLVEVTTTDDAKEHLEILLAMQGYCASRMAEKGGLFVAVMKKWYNDDIVGDEGILLWWQSDESRQGEEKVELKKRARPVVEFVLEQGSSDEEEDDE